MHLVEILAQTTAPGGAPATSGPSTPEPWWVPFFKNPLYFAVIALVIFFLFSNKAKGNTEKQRKQMLEQLKKGDVIQTIGGVIGSVWTVDGDKVVVKVDENTNTKMTFTRSAIHRVLEAEKAAK